MTRLSDIMETQDRLLFSKLFHKHRQVEVTLNRSVLAWKETEKIRKRSSGISNSAETAHIHALQVCEIVAVHTKDDEQDKKETRRSRVEAKQTSQLHPHAFTVSYVRRTRQHQWRCSEVTFHSANQALSEQWIKVINEQLALLTHRPKSLLVYINPYGGKRRGKRIYEQKVAPLFGRACISTDVIVTERANHARDHLKTDANLDKYDGVVCVGGDGMFSEILHGLISRTQTDNGVDPNQPDAELVPCSMHFGIIPAGSTDCICFATVGTNDPVTSALHIILGDSQPMDVCSVHHNDSFLRYSVSLLGYGFYGDVLKDSERKRWMGPARYDLSGVKTFLSHNYYEGSISFLPAENNMGDPRDKLQCRSGCSVCQHKPSSKDMQWEMSEEKEKSDKVGGWRTIRGKFIAINAASMSCACPRSPNGLSPSAHLADGTTDLILVRKCSRLDFLTHLLRHTNKEDQPAPRRLRESRKNFPNPNFVTKELRKLSWSGIPRQVRPITWKLLSGYLPANAERRESVLQRKRQEYFGFIQQYYDSRNDEHHQDTYRQIQIDIPRMSPESLVLQPKVTEIFERILFIWAIRHPASGYVQGINDLVTPFFVVYVFEYIGKCHLSTLSFSLQDFLIFGLICH
ncbi:ceramide kinase [Notothenia coriiceps]|uniref:Ceramide kinase n=1 Tax=Notothenia coriiceps TaxID=8208 RepID=A0A6I9PIS2_9TELE|nr:PREDICTED: ceramide kinase [Notothenia coriiceps]